MAKDYYDILGIEKGADKESIKKAYKKQAKKYHPDISKESNAESKFKDVNEAAGVLLDDSKRKQYDTYGSADGNMGGGFGGGFGGGGFNPEDFGIDLGDIFGDMFGGGFSGRRGQRQAPNTDLLTRIYVPLEDIYFGKEKNITIKRRIKCETCHGKGYSNDSDKKTCDMCDGQGSTVETQRTFFGTFKTQKTCSKCHGSGSIISNPCKECHGQGFNEINDSVTFKIPKGIGHGVKLRVSEKGNYSPETESYGDLYVQIVYEEHDLYDVEGSDLYTSLTVDFIQAVLGDGIELKHFDKKLTIKITEGTQPGTLLRLKSKGLPYFNSSQHGDLYLRVNVDIPKKLSGKQKDILKEFAKTYKKKSFFGKVKDFINN